MSLRLRFIVLNILVLIVVFTGLTLVLVRNSTEELRRTLLDQSKAFAALVTAPVGDTFVLYKDSGRILIDKRVRELQALNPGITNIAVVDVSGHVQYIFDSQVPLQLSAGAASAFTTQYMYDASHNLKTIVSPYFEANNSHRYAVVFTVSSAEIDRAIRSETRALVIAGLTALCVTAVAMFLFINRNILKPFAQVSYQAESISHGDLEQQIITNRNDEIGRLAASINQMTQSLKSSIAELRQLDQLKSEFMMIISHNLRTPLATINGSLDGLDENTDPKLVMKILKGVSGSAQRLSMFAEDTLNISQMELGDSATPAAQRELVSLDQLLSKIAEVFSDEARTKGVAFELRVTSLPAPVAVDKTLLRLAVLNLLDNALKFTATGGRITIALSHDETTGSISVTDTGIGIKPEEQAKLFTKFHRGTGVEVYNYEGIGIGLYSTKLMVERMGGSVRCESEFGKGSTFTISLPLEKTDSVA